MDANLEKLKNLLSMLARGDPGVISHPAASPENIGRIRQHYSIPEELMDVQQPIDNLFLCLRNMLANQFVSFFLMNKQKHMPVLRGWVVMYWRYFSPRVISKKPDILRACRTPEAVAEFENFLAEAHGQEKIPTVDLRKWFTTAFGDQTSADADIRVADSRDLGKNEEKATKQFALALYKIAPSIFVESKSELRAIVRGEKTSLEHVVSLVRRLMRHRYDLTPTALGIQIPIQSCVRRNIRLGSKVFDTSVDDILASLRGKSGTISCRPFSGVSTLMRMLAVSGAEDEKSKTSSTCYIDAEAFYRYVLTRRPVYEYLADLLVDAGLIKSDTRPSMVSQLQQLDQEGTIVFLVDDLRKLEDAQAEEVIQNLSFCPSVFYSIRLRDADLITNHLKKTNRSLCNLELLEMSWSQQDSMLAALLDFLGRADDLPLLHKTLLELRQDPGGGHDLLASPLGILALATSTDSQRAMRTQIVLAALNEMLAREGFGPFDLYMKHDNTESDGLRISPAGYRQPQSLPTGRAMLRKPGWHGAFRTIRTKVLSGWDICHYWTAPFFSGNGVRDKMAWSDPACSPTEIWEYSLLR